MQRLTPLKPWHHAQHQMIARHELVLERRADMQDQQRDTQLGDDLMAQLEAGLNALLGAVIKRVEPGNMRNFK